MMPTRFLILTKVLALAGIFLATILEFVLVATVSSIANVVGIVSALILAITQAMIIRHFLKITNTIRAAAEHHNLPAGVMAESTHLRRLIIPRSYFVLVVAAASLMAAGAAVIASSPSWLRFSLSLITVLAGSYTAFIEFIAFRLGQALQSRVTALLASTPPNRTTLA